MEYQEMRTVSGGAFGGDGVQDLIMRAETVCSWHRQHIELTNESALVAKKVEYNILLEEEKLVRDRLAQVPNVPGEKVRKRRIVINWIVAAVLVAAGFVLSVLTLEPFHWGMKGVVYSIAIALTVPFLVERVLDHFPSPIFRRVVLILACLAGLASVILLAAIRGKLLGEEVRQDSSAAIIEGDQPEGITKQNTFYEDTVPLLQLVMALLALSMEIGAGIAVLEAERMSEAVDGEYQTLKKELREIQSKLSLLAQEITALQNEAARFVAQFWRDFYWELLKTGVKNAVKRVGVPLVLLLLVCPMGKSAPQELDLVVALDLSKSVDAKGSDGKTVFEKNVSGVTDLLGKIPPGTRITVIGITDNSFISPCVLLKASLGTEEGYFGEKLAKGRQQIVQAWKTRSAKLTPNAKHTDIFGVLLLASAIFAEHSGPEQHVLVIYSDMQQSTTNFNMETASQLQSNALERLGRNGLVADLNGARVYVYAMQSQHKTFNEWKQIKNFWTSYFKQAGATLQVYSVLPESPNLN